MPQSPVDTKNKTITKTLITYLQEPYIDIKYATLFALTKRGDPDAIAPLEAMLKSGDLSLGAAPYIELQIDALKAKAAGKPPAGPGNANGASAGAKCRREHGYRNKFGRRNGRGRRNSYGNWQRSECRSSRESESAAARIGNQSRQHPRSAEKTPTTNGRGKHSPGKNRIATKLNQEQVRKRAAGPRS